MAKDSKAAVVSVRLSEEEQQRLRRVAETRGTTVSNLVRSAALREAGEVQEAQAVSVTTSPTSSHVQVEHGIFWDAPDHAFISSGTLSIRI
ncbi:DUF6290 family protein [Streptosporangium sandarakinum]